MLQEVKMDAKDAKSGKATMVLSMKNENNSSADSSGYEVSGDEKFDPLELKMNGKFFQGDKSRGVYYIKANIGSKTVWYKEKVTTDNRHAFNFKD